MKLNRGWFLAATAILAGSLAVTGCRSADDEDADAQPTAAEQSKASEPTETASNDVDVEDYAARGGGAHGGAHAGRGGARGGFGHGGFAHGRGGGFGRGWGHRGWGRGWDWGWWRHGRHHAWW